MYSPTRAEDGANSDAAPSGNTSSFRRPPFLTEGQLQDVFAYERRMKAALRNGNYKLVVEFIDRAWARYRNAHGAERAWFEDRGEAAERLAQQQAYSEVSLVEEHLDHLEERRRDALATIEAGYSVEAEEARYDLIDIECQLVELEELRDVLWHWVATYTPESDRIYRDHDCKVRRGRSQARVLPLFVRRRVCATPRSRRGSNTRRRGSRRNAASDDDAGGEPAKHPLDAPGPAEGVIARVG